MLSRMTTGSLPAFAIVLIVTSGIWLMNPYGYLGGGSDDWYYLQAARCAVAHHGLCPPQSHWGARLSLIGELAVAIAALGETRITLALVGLINAAAAAAFFTHMMERQFGKLEALIGGLALIATPVFLREALAINLDMLELALLLAALLALQTAVRRDDRRFGGAAGMIFALAILTRATAAASAPILAIAGLLIPALRRQAPPFVAGALLLLALNAAGYALWTGDPLRDWHLALDHAQIASTELDRPLRPGESPLFNLHLIGGWRREMGIHVHWSVDGLLNLLRSPMIGLTLLTPLLLLAVERQRAGRAAWMLAGTAALDFALLTYALAIDPKPRMFLLTLAAMAAVLGLLGGKMHREGLTRAVAAWLALSALLTIMQTHDAMRFRAWDPVAARWAAERPERTETSELAHRVFALVPGMRNVPVSSPPPAPS
jgi:4-amino-4-deoxy-L-arabinose transferase-like glycosyltransferase